MKSRELTVIEREDMGLSFYKNYEYDCEGRENGRRVILLKNNNQYMVVKEEENGDWVHYHSVSEYHDDGGILWDPVVEPDEFLIVTRHPALVAYLRELGVVGEHVEVISHASPEDVEGRHVIGVLPHSLSCLTMSFAEVPLALPPELRGRELTLGEIRRYAGDLVIYTVTRL